MTQEHDKTLAGKSAVRQKLTALPIAERLSILNQLRAREIALRGHTPIKPPVDSITKPTTAIASRKGKR